MLTHCILIDSSTVACSTSPLVILGVSGLFLSFLLYFRWKILLANCVDPDQMPHYVASDLGLNCLPMTLLWVSRPTVSWARQMKDEAQPSPSLISIN